MVKSPLILIKFPLDLQFLIITSSNLNSVPEVTDVNSSKDEFSLSPLHIMSSKIHLENNDFEKLLAINEYELDIILLNFTFVNKYEISPENKPFPNDLL